MRSGLMGAVCAGLVCCTLADKAEALIVDASGFGGNFEDGFTYFNVRFDTAEQRSSFGSYHEDGQGFGNDTYSFDVTSNSVTGTYTPLRCGPKCFGSQITVNLNNPTYTGTDIGFSYPYTFMASLTYDLYGGVRSNTDARIEAVGGGGSGSSETPFANVTILTSVPLPPSAPLFAVALLALGGIGYARSRRSVHRPDAA